MTYAYQREEKAVGHQPVKRGLWQKWYCIGSLGCARRLDARITRVFDRQHLFQHSPGRTMDFVSQNIFLITIAVLSGAMLLIPMLREAQGDASQVSPSQAVMLLNRQHAIILDVRETAELAGGRIEGSRHIPLGEIDKRQDELEKFKNRPVILACESGSRSGRAVSVLRKAGFAQVYNLAGGLKAWKEAGQPLSSGKKA
jgi:rhodanese-related sulfurtransferase